MRRICRDRRTVCLPPAATGPGKPDHTRLAVLGPAALQGKEQQGSTGAWKHPPQGLIPVPPWHVTDPLFLT